MTPPAHASPRGMLAQLTLFRLRALVRERENLIFGFVVPIVIMIVVGLAFRPGREPDPVVAITDGPSARALADKIGTSGGIQAQVMPPDAAREALLTGSIAAVLETSEPMRLRFDETRPEGRLARVVTLMALAQSQPGPAVREEPTVARGTRYVDYLVGGMVGLSITASSLQLVIFPLMLLRRGKILKIMATTAMNRVYFLLSFVIQRALLLVVELAVFLTVARLAFGTVVEGSLAALALWSLLGAMAFVGMGFFAGSRTSSPDGANGFKNLIFFPSIVLSGVFYSTEKLPDWMQPVLHVLPLTALNDGLRHIMNRGLPLSDLWKEAAVLAVWGVGSMFFALRVFKWT